ncbi:response regulator [Vibrio sp. CAU 1672]|uniref:response regulator n=1 Tax=Vibrio sp. CAU 1672 TaxID=3032594 RepID=UPI0023DBE9AC|nr:response regulator [Vibrio sp. CAU 1672]MDF2152178.1 ATP-binding protein [Vibrio sp. CAU 1672]
MNDSYKDISQQEALQEALVELQRARERERLLADENRAILSAISAIGEAENRHEIFYGLQTVLKKYIDFDDFVVISRDSEFNHFSTSLTTNIGFDNTFWLQGNVFERALNGDCILLFEPQKLKEFEALNSSAGKKIKSLILTGIRSEVTQNIILLIGGEKGHFSLENRETLRRFRPLIERALKEIEVKEKLQRIVEVRTIQLATAREEAEKANKSKSDFLAMMSHELRTPLNSVLGMLDVLKQSSLSGEYLDVLLQMELSAELLLTIISDILDLSKIESGSFRLNEQWCDVSDTVSFLILQQKQLAISKNLQFELQVSTENNTEHWLDPMRLSQILFNLVGNAVKFTDRGKVEVCIEIEANELFVTVEDSGIGIPADKLKNVFKAFHQADSSITRRFGGTGLGLAISKCLIELMKGTIDVTSEPNVGTKFLVSIPVRSRVKQSLPSKEPEELVEATDKALNILVVEDTQSNQLVIKLLLNKLGHNVCIANNGVEAVSLVTERQDSIDVIFMDVSMPVMDGITATELIRRKGIKTPIIALTAHAHENDKTKCIEAGMNGFVSKPIRQQDLNTIIRSHLCGMNH